MKKAAVSDVLKYLKEIDRELNLKEGKEIKLIGWVNERRIFKKIAFIKLKISNENYIQLVLNPDDAKKLKRDYVIFVKGVVRKRLNPNKNEKYGDYEIEVKEISIINECKELPFDYRGFTNISDYLKLKYRYLILRNKKYYENLKTRFLIANAMREFLISNGFIEVETPALTKSVPEGARDFLVVSRLYPGKFYALAQSPQLYKQLLMIAGFDKYFQFVKVFRDEDPREDRQPEFTQLDIEMANVDEEYIRRFIEKLVKYSIEKVLGKEIRIPFQEIKYEEAIEKYGSDKPDLRIPYELSKDSLYYLEIPDEFKKEIEKYAKKVEKEMKVKIDCNGYCKSNNPFALGKIRDFIGELEGYKNVKEYKFVWIINFPYFEEEDGNYFPSHHPFTLPKSLDNPKEAIGTNFDLVNNGYEIAGGSLRIYRRDLQEKIFELMGMKREEYLERYGWFLEALEYGAIPHGGIAFGFDRYIATLLFEKDIREVIAFPKGMDWKDYLTNSPSKPPKEYEEEVKKCCKEFLKDEQI